MIRFSITFCSFILFWTMIFTTEEATAKSLTIGIQSGNVHNEDSMFVERNRIYAPVRFMSEQLGATVAWDSERNRVEVRPNDQTTILISTQTREIKINGTSFWSDTAPIMREDRLYLPVRLMAELLHMKVYWDSEASTATISDVPRYVVQSGDTLEAVADRLELDIELLRLFNGLSDDALKTGQTLIVVFSQLLTQNEWSEEDLELMAKIIHIEAGYESMEGKIAVGNVIMNRVNSDLFPNTIREVIYQPGQFPPATRGKLDNLEPNESSWEAAARVLSGEQVAEDALYFYNPRVTQSAFFTSRQLDTEIGSHRFVK